MGNWSYLTGCESKAAAQADRSALYHEHPDPSQHWQGALGAKYCIPLVWIAGFEATDMTSVHRDGVTFEGLVAPTGDFLARIARRKAATLALLPEPLTGAYNSLVDNWCEWVGKTFKPFVFLDASDTMSMVGYDEAADTLRQAFTAFAHADGGGAVAPRAPVGYFTRIATYGAFEHDRSPEATATLWRAGLVGDPMWSFAQNDAPAWPQDPAPAEIAFAAALGRPAGGGGAASRP